MNYKKLEITRIKFWHLFTNVVCNYSNFIEIKVVPSLNEPVQQLTDHLFRNESKKMVSVLTKIFGIENLETAEDVVQDTLLQAMNVWKLKGIPDNPSAWLFRVAKNKAIDVIRKK